MPQGSSPQPKPTQATVPTPKIIPGGAPPNQSRLAPQMQAGLNKIQGQLAGKQLAPANPQQIVVNGKPTGKYLTGGGLVGNDPMLDMPMGYEQNIPGGPEEMPNWNKLTGAEQWLMKSLPGMPKPLTDALESFNNSWAGKALSYLDWPAEQVERFTGLVSQAAYAYGNEATWKDFTDNLSSAWAAGSLSADMVNFGVDVNADGSFRVQQMQDLPGIEGVIQSRKKITALVNQGLTTEDALAQVKNEYLASQGALAMRAQLQDTFFHLAGDPLNALLGFIKPVEWLHATREGILAAKIVKPAIEAEKAIQDAEQVLKVAEEAVKVAEGAEQIAAATDKLNEAKTALEVLQETQRVEGLSRLTKTERLIVQITGGLDSEMPAYLTAQKAGELLSKGKLGELAYETARKLNPLRLFQLTPESRAIEFSHVVMENLNTRVIGGAILKDGTYDFEKIVRSIERVAGGFNSPELGHLVSTLEGQHIAGIAFEIRDGAKSLLANYQAASDFERPLINMIGVAVGEQPAALLKQVEAGEHAALFTRFTEKMADNPTLAQAFQNLLARNGIAPEAFTADFLKTSVGVFSGNNLYDSGVAIAELGNLIADATAKQAIARFGLTHKGVVEALSETMKKAESLAFLKLNPAYPARNFFNNVVTMYARGAMGSFTPESIKSLYELMGFTPTRLLEGYGFGGIEEAGKIGELALAGKGISPLETGAKLIKQEIHAATKPEAGIFTKVSDWIQSVSNKVPDAIDMSKKSAMIEKWAGETSMATFQVRGIEMYGEVGKGMIPKIGDFNPELAKALGPELTKQIERMVAGKNTYLNASRLDQLTKAEFMPFVVSEFIDTAETKLGRPVKNIFTQEFMASWQEPLHAAYNSGNPEAVRAVFGDMEVALEKHVTELNQGALPTMLDETFSRVKIEGPKAFGHVYGNVVDEWWGGQARHAIDEAVEAEAIRNLSDPAIRRGAWLKNQAQSNSFFGRGWDRMESQLNGLMKGAEEAGLTGKATEVADALKNWRADTQEFFDFRNKLINDFFDPSVKNTQKWEDITAQIDAKYQGIIASEEKNRAIVDSIVGEMMPDDKKPLYYAWRERVNAISLEDKKALLEFRQRIRQMPYEQMQQEYGIFTKSRVKTFQTAWTEERSGIAALQGNGEAAAQYAEGVAVHQQVQDVGLATLEKKIGGAPVTPEEQAAIDQFIRSKDPATADYIDGLKQQLNDTGAPSKSPLDSVEGLRDYSATEQEISKVKTELAKAKDVNSPEYDALIKRYDDLSKSAREQAKKIGNKLSTPSVTADKLDPAALKDYGWTRGKKGLLSAVNADAVDAGRPRYTTLSEVPFDEAVKAIDKRVGNAADMETKAALVPRSQLPSELSNEIEAGAKRLADELSSGDSPTVYTVDTGSVDSVAEVTKRTPSSLPDWFQELSAKYKIGRKDVYAAIDKIIKDAGADKGKLVERVKKVILEEMGKTNPLTGEPPNEAALALLRGEPSAVNGADNVALIEKEIADTEAQVLEKFKGGVGGEPSPSGQAAQPVSLPDFEDIIKPENYTGTGLDQLQFTHGQEALRVMQEEALKNMQRPPTKWADVLKPENEAQLQRYFDQVKGGYADARYASTRFAEYGRDSALLNYNRRMNYNTALGTIFPYEFWATQSAMKWALHSIDRPAMLTSYLRIKKFLETAYRPEAGFPTRLKDMLRIPLPFLPDWMGGQVFIDPLSIALPFDKFASPYEQWEKDQTTDIGVATRKLQEMYNDGKITKAQFDEAQQTQSGATWERAVTLARQDDTQERSNGWDLASMLTAPHAPIQWAYNAATGKETGAVLPLTNTIGGVLSAFGLDPAGPLNPEAAIRKQLGFHPFNQWDDYYVDRMLSNMAADGTISADEARRAMIDRKGDAFQLAQQRAYFEKSGGPAGVFLGLFGVPVHAYPEGEQIQRKLRDEYTAAGLAYEASGDYKSTLGKFNDEHPEYEARLALYDKPEERLNKFLVDNIWNKWNDMPDVYKHEIANQLGPEFQKQFLDKETRNTKMISPDQLGMWLKLMGGDPPGSLTTAGGVAPLSMPSQDIAMRAQTFYDGRDNFFPGWKQLQDEYFKLETKGEKKQFLAQNKLLKSYWDWRRDFLKRNPQTVPYLTDLEKQTPAQARQYQNDLAKSDNQPHLTWNEWKQTLGMSLSALVLDTQAGDPLPPIARSKLQIIADQYGWSGSLEDFAKMIAESQ